MPTSRRFHPLLQSSDGRTLEYFVSGVSAPPNAFPGEDQECFWGSEAGLA